MSNVKIFAPVPFGLPTGAALTGAEWVPMDQTVGGVTTTIRSQASAIAALGISSASILGTANEIAVSVTGGVATISFSPNIVIPSPPSGNALTVNGATGATVTGPYAAVYGCPSGQAAIIAIQGNAGTVDGLVLVHGLLGNATIENLHATGSLSFITASGNMAMAAAGNITIQAPTSGQTLTAAAGADLSGILINGAQNNVSLTLNNTQAGATANWRISSSATGSGFGAGNLTIGSGFNEFVQISAAGGMLINSPSSGNTLLALGNSGGAAVVGQAGGGSNPSCFFAQGIAATKTQFMVYNQAGQGQWIWYAQASSNDLHLFNSTQGADTFTISGAGNWSIGAPTSGNTMQIAGASGLTALVLVETSGTALSINGATGSTYGASWSMTNTSVGATNITKSFRINPTGGLEIINNAFSAVIMGLSDAGDLTSLSTITVTGEGRFHDVLLTGPAATQLNAINIQQTGQTTWTIYQPASVSDLHIFSSSFFADTAKFGALGGLTLSAPGSGGTNLTLSAGASANQNLLAASNTAGIFLFDVISSGNFEMGTVGATQLSFYTNNSTRLAITGAGVSTFSGAVGIGITPDAQLLVFASGGASLRVGYTPTGGVDNYYDATDHNFRSIGAVQRATITAGLFMAGATGGDQGSGTINATGLFINGVAVSTGGGVTTGTFTATTTGLSAATIPCSWTKVGNSVTLFVGQATGTTGTGTAFSLGSLPAAIQPVTPKFAAGTTLAENNSTFVTTMNAFVTGSSIQFFIGASSFGWVAGVRAIGLPGTGGSTFTWDVT